MRGEEHQFVFRHHPFDRHRRGKAAIERQRGQAGKTGKTDSIRRLVEHDELFAAMGAAVPVEQRELERDRHRLLVGLARGGRNGLA